MEEKEIQRLLRLKRFETPGPDYFERFADEFRRRQRAELLRQPLWRLALDRIGAFFDAPSVARPAYALASAAVLVAAGVYSFSFLSEPAGQLADSKFKAATRQPVAIASAPVAPGAIPVFADLDSATEEVTLSARQPLGSPFRQASGRPHYVIDVRPASYDLSNSF
jgi:hypothetical protein